MWDFFKNALNGNLPNIFVLSGVAFLGIAVLGKIAGKFEADKPGRIGAAVTGTCLLVFGIILHVIPGSGGVHKPSDASTPSPTPIAPVQSPIPNPKASPSSTRPRKSTLADTRKTGPVPAGEPAKMKALDEPNRTPSRDAARPSWLIGTWMLGQTVLKDDACGKEFTYFWLKVDRDNSNTYLELFTDRMRYDLENPRCKGGYDCQVDYEMTLQEAPGRAVQIGLRRRRVQGGPMCDSLMPGFFTAVVKSISGMQLRFTMPKELEDVLPLEVVLNKTP
jgi:hypothetical protein